MFQPRAPIFKGKGRAIVTGLRQGITSRTIEDVRRVEMLRSSYVVYTHKGNCYTYPCQSVTVEVLCV